MTRIKILCASATLIMMASLPNAHAETVPQNAPLYSGEFSGAYLGVKLGENFSSASGGSMARPQHSTTFPGLMAGCGFDVGPVVLGAEAFADLHHGSATYKDAGVDVKLGIPMNHFMPYARLGFTGSWPEARLHGGLGIEYKLSKQIGISGEWTADATSSNGTRFKNNSFTVGVNYHFN